MWNSDVSLLMTISAATSPNPAIAASALSIKLHFPREVRMISPPSSSGGLHPSVPFWELGVHYPTNACHGVNRHEPHNSRVSAAKKNFSKTRIFT